MHRRPLQITVIVPGLVCILAYLPGCESPNQAIKYPSGALQVRYEAATTHSTCLVASVAMAANYLLGESRFSESKISSGIKQMGLDETRVSDLKTYLAAKDLHMGVYSGQLGDEPPLGLGYWVKNRGYPVICVINRDSVDPAFNHAVVVIGISTNSEGGSTDIIYYFDPSAAEPLQTVDASAFELLWSRGKHAMMIVLKPPAGSASN